MKILEKQERDVLHRGEILHSTVAVTKKEKQQSKRDALLRRELSYFRFQIDQARSTDNFYRTGF